MPDYRSFQLEGKKAIVTGPTEGIGHAVALGLAEAGCDVALVARRREPLEAVAAEVRERGRRALVVPTDQMVVAEIHAMVDQVMTDFGRIDVLVNCAGWTATRPALEVTEDEYDRTMGTLLRGVFFTCQAVGKHMIRQKAGKIVNLGSTFGVQPYKGRAVYSSAKAAIHQLTRALATEWGPLGVHVNAVAPCITETPTRRALLENKEFHDWILGEKLLTGRWAQPQDHVGAVLYLASPLSDMVMGHVLFVDGGWTAH